MFNTKYKSKNSMIINLIFKIIYKYHTKDWNKNEKDEAHEGTYKILNLNGCKIKKS